MICLINDVRSTAISKFYDHGTIEGVHAVQFPIPIVYLVPQSSLQANSLRSVGRGVGTGTVNIEIKNTEGAFGKYP